MRAAASMILGMLMILPAQAQQDPGKTVVGEISARVYFATNGDPASAGAKAETLSERETSMLRHEKRLRFDHYRLLGEDQQPLYRSYENWVEPLKPAEEVMIRFEAQSEPTDGRALIDLELWLARKKTIKTDAHLEQGRPLLVLGPEWRGGHLIIAVSYLRPNPATP